MSTLDEILAKIRAGISAEWNTTNSFEAKMPNEPDKCLAIYEYVGTPQYMLGGGGISFEDVRVQVAVRDTTYSAARASLVAVRTLLDVVGGVALSGTNYMRIMSLDTITKLEPDAQDRETLVLNFSVTKEPS